MSSDDHDLGSWTEDEIDVLVRDSLGEIEPDRFEQLLQQAIGEVAKPESPPQVSTRASSRKKSRFNMASTSWLVAAAAVVAIGVFAVADPLDSRDPVSQAGEALRTSTTRPAAQGPPRPVETTPTEPRPVCRLESGGGPITPTGLAAPALSGRVFRCSIDASDQASPSTVLITDDALIRDAVPVAGTPSLCVDLRSSSPELDVVPGECSGKGLRAGSAVAATYVIEYRLLSCAALGVPASCGPPGTDYLGRIIVDVGL